MDSCSPEACIKEEQGYLSCLEMRACTALHCALVRARMVIAQSAMSRKLLESRIQISNCYFKIAGAQEGCRAAVAAR